MITLDGQKPYLGDVEMGRHEFIQVMQLCIERERAFVAGANHAHQLVVPPALEVGVFAMKAINQPPFGVRLMLRNLLDENLIVEQMDLFAFSLSHGRTEPIAHLSPAPRSFAAITKRRLLRCAKRTNPHGIASSRANHAPPPSI